MNAAACFARLAAVGLVCEALLSAGSHGSADYAIPADSLDAGGRRSASSDYATETSFGSISGAAAASSPDVLVRHGYGGQLYEVRLLLITGNPSPVNEGDVLQLAAGLACDDDTRLALTPAAVRWTVLGGPASSISPEGALTAARVYAHERQVIQGQCLGWATVFETYVMDANPDNWGAYAGDGLPDAWQVLHFGPNNSGDAAPSADPDGDGQDNFFEYVAGLVPTQTASRFLLRASAGAGQPGVIFSPRLADRVYTVEYRETLDAGNFTPLPAGLTTDNGPERTVTDLHATEAPRFYRVRITRP